MDTEDVLRQILFELQEMNRKLDSLNEAVGQITGYGMCSLSDVKNTIEDFLENG